MPEMIMIAYLKISTHVQGGTHSAVSFSRVKVIKVMTLPPRHLNNLISFPVNTGELTSSDRKCIN